MTEWQWWNNNDDPVSMLLLCSEVPPHYETLRIVRNADNKPLNYPFSDIIREIYPPPFPNRRYPLGIPAKCKPLAEAISLESKWDHMPILADYLEDEGYPVIDILYHLRGYEPCIHGASPCDDCRGQGWRKKRYPHMPGCWALDILLGRF